ncbi:MAG: DNA primase [Verrucomicrobiae bacterium]|nr:DNA primase [Verrucomicrobiae bacterium]
MGRIPQEKIDEVLAATDIVDLIGSYFPLKRAGGIFKALCPFHIEKSESFTVTPSRGTFHCFGCHKHGTAIRFVMEYENLPFADTVRKLADRVGIRIEEEFEDEQTKERNRKRKELLALHRDIAKWYQRVLLEAPVAETAREYLKNRGFSAEAIERWQVGYAPADGHATLKWAQKYDYPQPLMISAGLLALRDEGNPTQGCYTRFRDRVMFPICGNYGDVIAFSGRVLDPAASPAKYMNSPETPIFTKGKVLYGFDKSRTAIAKADQAIVCEGQIDLIMCFEQGVENVIAPLGTAFTPDHARIIRRQTDEVVLCYDSDNAGIAAAERTFVELAKANVFVKVASIPDGKDPDEFIRNHGVDAFTEIIKNAKEYVDFQINAKSKRLNLSDTRDRVRFSEQMAEIIATIDNKVAFEAAIQKVATRLAMPPIEFHRQVTALARRSKYRNERPGGAQNAEQAPPADQFELPNGAIRILCVLALTKVDGRKWLKSEVDRTLLTSTPGAATLFEILDAPVDITQPLQVSGYLSQFSAKKEAVLNELLSTELPGNGESEAREIYLGLIIASLERDYQTKSAQLRSGNVPAQQLLQLTLEIQELGQEILAKKQSLRP